MPTQNHLIKPAPLTPGDTVILVTPGHQINSDELQFAIERMAALQLTAITPPTILDRYGYFAGCAEDRAQAINTGFSDPNVKAIIAIRGGSGSSLLLDQLDYDLIKKNPKIFLGMSDITALLLAIHEKTGLITFHGPNAGAKWPAFSTNYVKAILFNGETVTLQNPRVSATDDLIQTQDRLTVINAGSVMGPIIGGNLTVISTLMGSDYLPQDWTGKILFLEDVGEETYRIDRMFAQLKNAGILGQLAGFVFGTCQNCLPLPHGGFQLNQVIERYIKPLQIPAFSGALIGHQALQFTVPVGLPVKMEAECGKITLLEPAVQ